MLKVFSHDILMQEIPGEISLSLSISGCPYKCKFCHTPDLQKDVGEPYEEVIDGLIEKYQDGITCVLFMGGDNRWKELYSAAEGVRKKYGLKAAVYLGSVDCPRELFYVFDYIKLGPYVHELGGLGSPKTNQRLYKITNNQVEDITGLFWRKKI